MPLAAGWNSDTALLFASGVLLVLCAVVALVRGIRPPRTGDTPHCRRCDYTLTGLPAGESPKCPECGLALSGPNVVYGERRRARGLVYAGSLLLTLGLALSLFGLFDPLRSANWYRHKPTAWVINDLTSANPELRAQAWTELDARRTANRLSPEQQSRLDGVVANLYATAAPALPAGGADYVFERFQKLPPEQQTAVFRRLHGDLTSNFYNTSKDASRRLDRLVADSALAAAHHAQLTETALRAQVGPSDALALDWLLEYLAARELAGQLAPEQREQFFVNCFKPTFEVRPTMPAGESVPYRINLTGRGPRNSGWHRIKMLTSQVDDRKPAPIGGSMGGSGMSGGGSVGSWLPVAPPGRHTIRIDVEVQASDGQYPANPDKVTPRWSRRMSFTGQTEILTPGTNDLTWIDDPALAGLIRKTIALKQVRAAPPKSYDAFAMTVELDKPPANLAFEIFARDATGKEHPVGTLTAIARKALSAGVSTREFPPGPAVGHVDLVFRSSEKVMRRTTDLYEAWRGEIVFEKVPVSAQKR